MNKDMILVEIEYVIISSFIQFHKFEDVDNFNATELFKLDPEYFTRNLNRKLALKINECDNILDICTLISDIELMLASAKIEVQDEYLKIISQTPLPLSLARKYYENVLIKRNKIEKIKRLIQW